MNLLRTKTAEFDSWKRLMLRRRQSVDSTARESAASILELVRIGGDRAVAGVVARFDRETIVPDELLVIPGSRSVAPALASAISVAAERIRRFHAPQLRRSYELRDGNSILRHDVVPLRRVGIYVPGGAATYISTLLMCAIPARIAGVEELVVVTTPRAARSAELQYVCTMTGITEIYRAGGAAGIAALAYGTESLRRVDKIVGPGNRWVAAAKQLVASVVGVDLIAGPSEIVVCADDSADPRVVAADLLAQAEHGEDSSPVCITTSTSFASELQSEIARRLGDAASARAAVERNGAVILASSIDDAAAVINDIAPEHLEVQIREPDRLVALVENCAAIYVGAASGVALGDYVIGSNHVLPTAGSARFSSPLGVDDFVKRRSVIRLSAATASELGSVAAALATAEGLPLHARSAELRVSTMTAEACGSSNRREP